MPIDKKSMVLYHIFWSDLDFPKKPFEYLFQNKGYKMSRDYSEYESSKYDKYLKDRTPENGSVLSVLSNRATFNIDDKKVELWVDYSDEYFFTYKGFSALGDGFERYFQHHRDEIAKIQELISDTVEYEKVFEARQKLNIASGKIDFEFLNEKRMKEIHYGGSLNPVIYPKINIFCDSTIKLDLAEGLFDFIYADFKTPLDYLLSIYEPISDDEIFRTETHKVYNKSQKNSELILDYAKTFAMLKPLLYASIYSGICPPRFDFDNDFIEQLKWFGNYLIRLQKEYIEKIQFCFDNDYYPEMFLCSYPSARYFLYKVIKGIPRRTERTEEMYLDFPKDSYGEKIYKNREYVSKARMLRDLKKEDYDFLKDSELEIRDVYGFLRFNLFVNETYMFSKIDELLELEFTKMLSSNIKIKKCKRCGKYFRVKGKYPTECCSRIAEGEGRLCREIASAEKYKAKMADNQALQIYNKYYKRYMARVKVKQIKEEKFLDWQYESLSMRDACERDWITVEEYIDFNESFFPNRKKKENK